MFANLLLIVSLLFAPKTNIEPDSVAVLTLDAAKKTAINTKLLRQTFNTVLTEELKKAPVLGDSFNNLTSLFGCDERNTSCLIEINKSLQVRFVIYGSATLDKTTKEIIVDFGLYDSLSDKEISRSKGPIKDPEDKESLGELIDQLLSNSIAAPLRKTKMSAEAVPFALQTEGNVDKKVHDPRRWLIVPGGLTAGWAIIGLAALPLGVKLQKAKFTDEAELDRETQQELGDKRAKFKALLITADIALITAVAISPLALRQYKKEKKAMKEEQRAAANQEAQPK